MTDDAIVNYFPTMVGGTGKEDLHKFYTNHFVNKGPKPMKMRLVSRTIGFDRLVDEMMLSFTHDAELPWMLPGVKPTGKHIEVAVVMIVGIRGKKIYSMHIHWDQATVLAQAGLINARTLPVIGVEAARKLIDHGSSPSNPLLNTK
jgi:carboxymethylenebutenolidase